MKKAINPQAIAIQRRFFEALDYLIDAKRMSGLKPFCDDNQLNRTKYSRIRNSLGKPLEETTYKLIDMDALAALCRDYGVSAEWLLLGIGKMLKTDKRCTFKKV